MRGDDEQQQAGMFSYIALEDRIPKRHPLRGIRQVVDEVLQSLSQEFDKLYAQVGRPSIPPERLLRALLLQALYSIWSERLLMEQLEYNLLFRWFVGLEIDDTVWNHAVFSKNRERLLNQEMAQMFFRRVKEQAGGLMSDEHFTVDGTLLQGWASQKSFQRKPEELSAQARRAFSASQKRVGRDQAGARIFVDNSVRTIRTSRRPMRRRGRIVRARGRKPR
jgi:transposase